MNLNWKNWFHEKSNRQKVTISIYQFWFLSPCTVLFVENQCQYAGLQFFFNLFNDSLQHTSSDWCFFLPSKFEARTWLFGHFLINLWIINNCCSTKNLENSCVLGNAMDQKCIVSVWLNFLLSSCNLGMHALYLHRHGNCTNPSKSVCTSTGSVNSSSQKIHNLNQFLAFDRITFHFSF